ncbi:MAG: hypothetical protein HY826_07220, partial [Actinobacteria bacterium]|nr:hypothetical protein [Actinomycetota bacterium]
LSQVSFIIDETQTYWIAVDGVGFARGETDVVFDVPPAPPPTTNSLVSLCTPVRVLDTRTPGGQTVDGLHQAVGQIGANTSYELPVINRGGVPADAQTVVLNVTAVLPIAAGFVTVYPCGQAVPNASNLNFAAGDVIPNSVLARVGDGGKVCLFSSATTDLLVDVSGYFRSVVSMVPLGAPGRILDTRSPSGQTIDGMHQAVGAVAAGGVYELPVLNRAGVPPAAQTVVLNVTAVLPAAGGFVTVFPCGQAVPNASNLNFVVGDVIPNSVLARVGDGGKVCLYTSATTDLLVDVSGYFGSVVSLTPLGAPARVLDTRSPSGQTVDGLHQAVGQVAANSTYQLPIAGRAGVPADAQSVVLNVTAVLPGAPGFVTVFPCGQAVPNASNLNYTVGDVIPNSVVARVGSGGNVCLFSSAATDLLVDVSGYFGAGI